MSVRNSLPNTDLSKLNASSVLPLKFKYGFIAGIFSPFVFIGLFSQILNRPDDYASLPYHACICLPPLVSRTESVRIDIPPESFFRVTDEKPMIDELTICC